MFAVYATHQSLFSSSQCHTWNCPPEYSVGTPTQNGTDIPEPSLSRRTSCSPHVPRLSTSHHEASWLSPGATKQ